MIMAPSRALILFCLCCLFPVVVLAILRRQRQQQEKRSLLWNAQSGADDYENETVSDALRKIPEEATTIHLIALVHGLMGTALEMDTLKQMLHKHSSLKAPSSNSSQDQHHFIIHSPTCNEQRTHDGIAAGGTRLAEDINQILRSLRKRQQVKKRTTVTLSFVGNSLGGLYSRYALGEIEFSPRNVDEDKNDDTTMIDVIPKLFVTTVTPHLGVSQHTYVKLPRFLERIVASILQQSGLDLFSFSPMIRELTFHAKYVKPLLRFEQRIAYANVHGTDFQVPTATAAFWENSSDSEHFLQSDGYGDKTDQCECDETESGLNPTTTEDCPELVQSFSLSSSSSSSSSSGSSMKGNNNQSVSSALTNGVVGIYTTRPNPTVFADIETEEEEDKTIRKGEDVSFSKQLDAMGWTKVLVDVRPHLPSLKYEEYAASKIPQCNDEEEEIPLRARTTLLSSSSSASSSTSAKELLAKYGGGRFSSLPFGHTVLIANAKDALHRWFNQGGIPTMDSLAGNIVDCLLPTTSDNNDEL